MKKALPLLSLLLTTGFISVISSCGGDTGNSEQTTKAGEAATSKAKKKGRIYDKINIVQIPLTAIENNIHGKVKSVRYVDYKFVVKGGQYEKQIEDSGHNVYDNFGHLIDQNEYNADGKQKWKCIYRYDSNNRAIDWNFNFMSRNAKQRTIFAYDAAGRKIEENLVSSDKKNSRKTLFKYDDQGNEIEETVYLPDGSIGRMTKSKYDEAGNQIELSWAVTSYGPRRKEVATYDANGNRISTSIYSADTLEMTSSQTFDNKGRAVESKYSTGNGDKQRKSTFRYDEWDNITEYISYKPDNTIDIEGWNVAYEYEYDQKGNKTKETSFQIIDNKRVPDYYTETTYTYYE
jgi:hypothetical protein